MKRLIVKLIAASLLCLAGALAHAGTLEDVKARGTLICGVLGSLEPFSYPDTATREQVGYEIDLCRDLATDLGVKLQLRIVSTQSRIPELLEGRVDILAALISYTPERVQQLLIGDAYVADGFNALVNQDSGITKLDQLADKRLSVIKGSFLEPLLQKRFPKATVLSFEDSSASFTALIQGRAAANVQRATSLRALQLRLGSENKTVMLEELLAVQKSGFAIRKGEEAFLERTNKFLHDYEASGKAVALWEKWLGQQSKFKLPRAFKVGDNVAD